MQVAVLSPHLDDAVLSVGGLIGREIGAGNGVEVVTCFTAGPSPDADPTFGTSADYAARRAEDERALAVLGASHRWLDLPERAWRDPPLPGPLHAFRTPDRIDGFGELEAISDVIADLARGGAVVYAPLGVGNHADHVEVALAAMSAMLRTGAFSRVRFYEDPYAMSRRARRRHLVTERRTWPFWRTPAWASPRVGLILFLIGVAARGPRIQQYLPEVAQQEWTCVPIPLSYADEDQKFRAIAEYESQVEAFGGIRRLRRFLHRGHEVLGGEPVWACQPRVTTLDS